MLTRLPRSLFLVVPALFMAGSAIARPAVEVTRFHDSSGVRSGTVRIVAEEGMDAASLEYRTFANAVADALKRTGFSVVDDPSASYVARVGVDRSIDRPVDQRGSPVSVGVGGSTGSYGGGLGVGIGINLSGKPKAVIGSQLRVQLRQADAGVALWEGRAETAAKENSSASQAGVAAGTLADALFRDYPGKSGATIRVK